MTPSSRFIGARLRQAREALGLTETALSEILRVTRQAVSNWETGRDSPRPEIFDELCRALRQPSYFFTQPLAEYFQHGTIFYRSLSSTTKTARLRAQARKLWAREIAHGVQRYVEFPEVHFPRPEIPNPLALTGADIDKLAQLAREFWGVGTGPMPNLVRLLENNGAVIIRDNLDSETLDALSEWLEPENRPLVLLNADKSSAVRSRLDLAHETAHLVIHRSVRAEHLNKKAIFSQIEKQAFRFGGALLLPEKPFLSDLYSLSLDALRTLKSKWLVSIGAMISRLSVLGILSDDQQRRMWINYRRRGWSEQEPLDDQIAAEAPSLLPVAFKVLSEEGMRPDQIPAIIGHGRSQIEALANLPRGYFEPALPSVNVIRFPKAN